MKLGRSIKFFFQRIFRGWDDSETWNIDHTIAGFAIPRLRRFKEVKKGYPADLMPEEWDRVLDKMILSMEWFATDVDKRDDSEETYAQVQEGMTLFGKHFGDLWW